VSDAAAPTLNGSATPRAGRDVLVVDEVTKHFVLGRGGRRRAERVLRAVDGVSFALGEGETLGLVGESGSGKSTLGRLIVGLMPATSGRITFEGRSITGSGRSALRSIREDVQMVFQDPYMSLDPKMPVGDIVAEPLRAYRRYGRATGPVTVRDLLDRVGIPPSHIDRYPREFSGGQRQRIGIARALALSPKLLVLDEPVSALDVSVQAQILNLLRDLQEELGVSYLFISHDLSVVQHIAHRVAVMYLGRLVEVSETDALFESQAHPYTSALLSAVPKVRARREASQERIVLSGSIPSPIDPPSGCTFRTRCWQARDTCAEVSPTLQPTGSAGRQVSCAYPLEPHRRLTTPPPT
jgi:oligopeptide/dipeptide ABC transporter ATP-binding protein